MEKDDSFNYRNAQIVFTPPKAEEYKLIVTSSRDGATGVYTLRLLDIRDGAEGAVTEKGRAIAEKIDLLRVEEDAKYSRGDDGTTYCNQFVHDATARLDCKIPWKLANDMHDWLIDEPPAMSGWFPVNTGREAQRLANEGLVVVGAWKNLEKTADGKKYKPGHIVMVRPHAWGMDYDLEKGPQIAQAGATNFASGPAS